MAFPTIKRYIVWTGILALLGVVIALYKTNKLKYAGELKTGVSYPTFERSHNPQKVISNDDIRGDDIRGNNSVNGNKYVNGTYTDPLTRLHEACKNVDMNSNAYKNWANPSYVASPSLGIMLCPLKLVKADFWKDFHKVFRKDGRKKGAVEREKTVHFGDEEAKHLKLMIMSINPYTWILQGYIERSLLGGDICKETKLQRYVDRVISGIKLRQNQGLFFTPLVPSCRPCDVNIHSVVRYENFESDMTSVLHSLKLDHVKSQLLRDNIRDDVTEMTLAAIRHYALHECSNITFLPVRLFEAFKIKGYVIPDKLKDYLLNLKHFNSREVRGAVSTLAYGTKLTSAEERHALEKEYYNGIFSESVQYIQEIFSFEFEAFGYNKTP